MPRYYVNRRAQDSGEHEVHQQSCRYLPTLLNRRYLGSFRNCHAALEKARTLYRKVDGCYFCSRDCNTG